MTLDQFIKKYWKQIQAALASMSGGIVPAPAGGMVPFATDFLVNWKGGSCPLFLLSDKTSEAEVDSCIAWLKQRGYTVVNPYFFNVGDGDGKHGVNVLSYDASARLAKLAKHFAVVPFFWADDSATMTSRAPGVLISDSLAALNRYGKYLSGIIPFLEPGDVGDTGKVRNVIVSLINAAGNLPVILHTNSVGTGPDFSKIDAYLVDRVKGIAFQSGNPASPVAENAMVNIVSRLKARYPNHWIIAMEYAFSKPSLGDKAILAGATGVGNECSQALIAKLPKILKMV